MAGPGAYGGGARPFRPKAGLCHCEQRSYVQPARTPDQRATLATPPGRHRLDGSPTDTVLAAARAAEAAGLRIIAVGFGAEGDILRPLLERVASAPADFHLAPDAAALEQVYRSLIVELTRCP